MRRVIALTGVIGKELRTARGAESVGRVGPLEGERPLPVSHAGSSLANRAVPCERQRVDSATRGDRDVGEALFDTALRLGPEHRCRDLEERRLPARREPEPAVNRGRSRGGQRRLLAEAARNRVLCPKQFGVDVEQMPALLADIGRAGLAFEGFHLFAGSQNLRADSICEAQQKSFDLAVRLAQDAPGPVKFLNLGGGFGIPYFPGDQRLDLAPIGANLQQLLERAKAELPHAELVIELGRYLVAEAGVYVTRVVDRKISRGQVYLVTDGGLNHHLSASGNFGQVVRKNYPVTIGNRQGGGETEQASVVGPLCTPLDLLADRMQLPVAGVGDLAVVFQSGAYGASASPQAFLGHAPCTEVLV